MNALNYDRVDEAMKVLKTMVADVPYSNKKLVNMGMEERYRFIFLLTNMLSLSRVTAAR